MASWADRRHLLPLYCLFPRPINCLLFPSPPPFISFPSFHFLTLLPSLFLRFCLSSSSLPTLSCIVVSPFRPCHLPRRPTNCFLFLSPFHPVSFPFCLPCFYLLNFHLLSFSLSFNLFRLFLHLCLTFPSLPSSTPYNLSLVSYHRGFHLLHFASPPLPFSSLYLSLLPSFFISPLFLLIYLQSLIPFPSPILLCSCLFFLFFLSSLPFPHSLLLHLISFLSLLSLQTSSPPFSSNFLIPSHFFFLPYNNT